MTTPDKKRDAGPPKQAASFKPMNISFGAPQDDTPTTREVRPGPDARSVRSEVGQRLTVPDGWVLVPPGDPALTRRIKAAGPCWTMKEKRGRRMTSLGVWTDGAQVDEIRAALEAERADPAYAKRLAAGRVRREATQEKYVEDFEASVFAFLAFAKPYEALGRALATAIAKHATPVGSGTVARTKRIPVQQRAEAATIAWLRHQTTGYDDMRIPLVAGKRREVRRELAERSRLMLRRYRDGEIIPAERCPLRVSLGKSFKG